MKYKKNYLGLLIGSMIFTVAGALIANTVNPIVTYSNTRTATEIAQSLSLGNTDSTLTEAATVETSTTETSTTDKQNSTIDLETNNIIQLNEYLGKNKVTFEATLGELYAERNYAPIWNNEQVQKNFLTHFIPWVISGVSANSRERLVAISNAETQLQRDILLSDALLDYLNFNENVNKNANKWLYGQSKYISNLPSDATIQTLKEAIKNDTLVNFIQQQIPQNRYYKNAIKQINQSLPSSSVSSVMLNENLKPGQSSKEVDNLVAILKEKQLLNNDFNSQQIYSDELILAVKKFQAQKGLTTDGIVGPATRNALNNNPSNQLYKLAINAQRYRVLPNYENGIFVNIPTYQLYYYRNGNLVLNSRVIVGKAQRPTPVMHSRLSDVVVNPPWNAPTTLINEDLIPKVRRDPSYIYRNGYTIIDRQGRTIDPYTIDWENMTAKNFPHRLRQAPGGDSALGNYKFNMPSPDAIFLHDTPSRGLFNRDNRALSSGCIRVHKADELASLLLGEAGWSNDKRKQVLSSKKTTKAVLPRRDDVYLYYVTAWVEDDGKIKTAPDIYNHDRKLPTMDVNWSTIKALLN